MCLNEIQVKKIYFADYCGTWAKWVVPSKIRIPCFFGNEISLVDHQVERPDVYHRGFRGHKRIGNIRGKIKKYNRRQRQKLVDPLLLECQSCF
jgi:hypothetical protein